MPHQGEFNEYPQHMFLYRIVENYPRIIVKILLYNNSSGHGKKILHKFWFSYFSL